MRSLKRLYLDANIFIAIFESKDEIGIQLERFLCAVPERFPTFITTSELTFAETMVEPYRRRDEALISLYENWSFSNSILEVGPVTRDVLYQAAVLRADNSGLKLPDAIHLATAFAFGCSHFLTADRRLGESYELRQNRFGISHGASRTIRCLRPDLETIATLIAATT